MNNVIYRGSVKTILGVENTSPYIFEFSDRYSVFDWGEMPDLLDGKGKSLAAFAWFFFSYLERPENWRNWNPGDGWRDNPTYKNLSEKGLKHHGIGLVDEKGEKLPPGHFSNFYAVHPVKVVAPKVDEGGDTVHWDYSYYNSAVTDHLVPLEVIFRFAIPEGSSLLSRASDMEYCRSLGLSESPKVGDVFDRPIIEFSTKLESRDRYISYEEAKDIAGLNDREFTQLKDTVTLLAMRLKTIFSDLKIDLLDGKFEFSFTEGEEGNRGFSLVDSIGPDELRLMYDGIQLSKESLRRFYRGGEWQKNVEKSKKLADERGVVDWKSICRDELNCIPEKLDEDLKTAVEMIYQGLCEKLLQRGLDTSIFPDAWDFEDIKKVLK